jgi:hypothetical protein
MLVVLLDASAEGVCKSQIIFGEYVSGLSFLLEIFDVLGDVILRVVAEG